MIGLVWVDGVGLLWRGGEGVGGGVGFIFVVDQYYEVGYRDFCFIQYDIVVCRFQGEGLFCIQYYFCIGFKVVFYGGMFMVVLFDFLFYGLVDVVGLLVVDLEVVVFVDGVVLIVFNVIVGGVLYDVVMLVVDVFLFVVMDVVVQVFLCVDVDLFLVFFVVYLQGVVVIVVWVVVGFEGGVGLLGWQFVWRDGLVVVECVGDYGVVWVVV